MYQRVWLEVDKRLASKGVRRPWLEKQTGIPLGRINNWANRGTLPRVDEGVKIAESLQTSAVTLLTGEELPGVPNLPPDLREVIAAYLQMPERERQAMKYICRITYQMVKQGYLSIPSNFTIQPPPPPEEPSPNA